MNKNSNGFSLIEILVVISIFAALGILVTSSVILTLQGSRKSESLVNVGQNVNYTLGVIERQIRNANSIIECPNPDRTVIDYIDQYGTATSFSCINPGLAGSYVASGSARLTSDQVTLVSCSFTCTPSGSNKPPLVGINLVARDASAIGIQNATISASTQIYLRSY